MKITGVRTVQVDLRPEQPAISRAIPSFGCVLVFLDTDLGLTGETLVFSFGNTRTALLDQVVQTVGAAAVGEDPRYTERIGEKLWAETDFFGDKGLHLFGLSAIDRACWDVVGKAEGKPVYKLLGPYRDTVPAYGSGLWLFLTVEELVRDAQEWVAMGFRAMKMRIGKGSIDEDVERVRAVRQAIGPSITLMVDAHRAYDVKTAIRLARRLEAFDLAWFEEPVQAYDHEGSARVAAALDIPIASGEGEYSRYGFRGMISAKAADILMPDLMRVGGITEAVKVAHLARAYDLPVTPHSLPQESMHLVAAVANGLYVEYMHWFSALYREKVALKEGMIVLPDRPGFGFTFDLERLTRYRVGGGG